MGGSRQIREQLSDPTGEHGSPLLGIGVAIQRIATGMTQTRAHAVHSSMTFQEFNGRARRLHNAVRLASSQFPFLVTS